MSKWNTSYLPSSKTPSHLLEEGGAQQLAAGFAWLSFGPLQAGVAVLISLLVLQPPFVMDKEDDYQTLSLTTLCIWVLLSMAVVWGLPKVLPH